MKTINVEDYNALALVNKDGTLEIRIKQDADFTGAEIVVAAMVFGIQSKSEHFHNLIEEFKEHISKLGVSYGSA